MNNYNQELDASLSDREFYQPSSNASLLLDSSDSSRRRSSNRSIKRKKFDDELVDYSRGLPGVSTLKLAVSRNTFTSSSKSSKIIEQPTRPRTSSTQSEIMPTTPVASPVAIPPQAPPPAVVEPKRKTLAKPVPGASRRGKKGKANNQISMKDLGRWKPTDDLALIIGVQQTNDLKTIHLGTKFSCRFTMQELQQRWYALLYDEAVSRVAVTAMRNLHPDMVAAVQDKALWSNQEEELLGMVKSHTNPTIHTFSELLAQHPDTFHSGRTPVSLLKHWNSLKTHNLLPDQTRQPIPIPYSSKPILYFSDAEDLVTDADLTAPTDEWFEREFHLEQRRNVKEIRQLENEIGRWNVLVDSVTGACPSEMDNHTLAVLRGRMVRYLMRSREITIGRKAKGNSVDIDLNLEGPAYKISRRQATLRLRNTGEFYLSSEGKRPIFVDGRPILNGNKVRLFDNAIVEIACLRFIFSINQDLIRVIQNEAIKMNIPT